MSNKKEKHPSPNMRSVKVQDLIDGKRKCPLPLDVIPNHMGINLCSVDSIEWNELEDGQLTSLTIVFTPDVYTDNQNFDELIEPKNEKG